MFDKIFTVVALPPPVTGQSHVNQRVVDSIFPMAPDRVIVLNIAPVSLWRGFMYHLSRIFRIFWALLVLSFYGLGALLFRRKFCIYFVYEAGWGVIYNYFFVFVAKVFGYKIFIHHHTAAHTISRSASFERFSVFLGSQATHVVLSRNMANDLLEKYRNIKDVIVSSNYVHVDSACGLKRSLHEKVVVGYISNICVEKGADVVFSLARNLLLEGFNVKFVLAGPVVDGVTKGNLDSLLRDFPDSIEYAGALYGDGKLSFFKEIDFLVFPTLYKNEAQPLVVLEALSYGLPACVIDRGYIPEFNLGRQFHAIDAADFLVKAKGLLSDWLLDNGKYGMSSGLCLNIFNKNYAESAVQFEHFLRQVCGG